MPTNNREQKTRSWNFGGVRKTYEPGRFFGFGPKNYRRSDERILEEVCHLLKMRPDIDATDIEVSVSDGVVWLSGSVPSRYMKKAAGYCLEEIAGVREVQNQLSSKMSDRF